MKVRKRISTPEKLNEHLQATSPITWILLGVIILCLVGFFVWAMVANITYKLEGSVSVVDGVISINYDENKKEEIKPNQKIIINDIEGEITNISEDGVINISIDDLADGNYQYVIILKEIHPIEYLIDK